MNAKTRENLLKAMRSEAVAYASYILYARCARASRQHEIAELFELAAEKQFLDRFTELAELLELVGTDAQNLRAAIEGTAYAGRRSYRGFARQAQQVGEDRVAERLLEIRGGEWNHVGALRLALAQVERHRSAPATRPAMILQPA